jgi:sec-independent protein translocase protein TatA
MPGWIGFPELLVLLLVVLLVFGPKRLPEMGRSLGRGMREFKDSITGKDNDKAQIPPPAPNIETSAAATAPETDKVSTS